MVIGQRFIIGHPGKTGGDAILHLCSHLSSRHQLTVDDPADGRKHHYFHRRSKEEPELQLEGKERLLSFRRLPDWLASYHAHFNRQRGLPVNRDMYGRGYIPFLKSATAPNTWDYAPGDALLQEYLDRPVLGYIRAEYLKEDLLRHLRRYLNLSASEVSAIRHDNFFKQSPQVPGWRPVPTDSELREMRRNNPVWTAIEDEIYASP